MLATNLSAIIDCVALVVIIVFTLIGLIKGFAKTFVSMFGTLLSLLFSALLCKTVANFLQDKFSFVTTVSNWASGIVTKVFGDNIANVTIGEATQELLASQNFSQWMIGLVLSIKGHGTIPTDTTLNNIITPVFGYYTVLLIAFIGLFILFKVLFFLIAEIIKDLHSIKLIGVTDTILGGVLGLIHGILTLQIVLLCIQLAPLEFSQNLAVLIDSSVVAGFLGRINLFALLIRALNTTNLTQIITDVLMIMK